MENQNKEFLLTMKRQEFKSRREDVKETFKIRCADAQHDLQHQMAEAYRMTEANLRKERDEALAAICLEEDQFNIEWAAEKFRRSQTVRPWINEKGEVTGVAVYLGDIHFFVALDDLYDGERKAYNEINELDLVKLPSERVMRVFCLYRKEINAMLEENGGKPVVGWRWTKIHTEDIYANDFIKDMIIFNGDTGDFGPAGGDNRQMVRMFVELP